MTSISVGADASRQRQLTLTLAALGVVFGDIGTSPLYALKEVFYGHHHLARTETNIIGALSLFFWSLLLVVTVKYVIIIMRADNQGEGGIFALLSLLRGSDKMNNTRAMKVASVAILVGAALLYGDGVITPAISVLSAWEGLEVATPTFKPVVVPLTVATLAALFTAQKNGTDKIGRFFGPVMMVWFATISWLAIPHLLRHPEMAQALNPLKGITFLREQGLHSSLYVLGAVVLCITGGEALYADMGHFGPGPIRRAWFFMAYPSLLLNYFGQGARMLDPGELKGENPFFSLVPEGAIIPMVLLATAATIIASQALISGAFSLTQQAIALGVLPRVQIIHTNSQEKGQIYLPFINWMLFGGCLWLVLSFQSSSALAAAYGIAVTGTMSITTAGFYLVATRNWKWSRLPTLLLCGSLIGIDLAFFSANAIKFFHGGYVPVIIAGLIVTMMLNWQWGRTQLAIAFKNYPTKPVEWLVSLKAKQNQLGNDDTPHLTTSYTTQVFLSSNPITKATDRLPISFHSFLDKLRVCPVKIVFLTVKQVNRPEVTPEEQEQLVDFGSGIYSVILSFGYMQEPNIEDALKKNFQRLLEEPYAFQIGQDDLFLTGESPLTNFWLRLFRLLLRRVSRPANHYFGLKEAKGKVATTTIPIEAGKNGFTVHLPIE